MNRPAFLSLSLFASAMALVIIACSDSGPPLVRGLDLGTDCRSVGYVWGWESASSALADEEGGTKVRPTVRLPAEQLREVLDDIAPLYNDSLTDSGRTYCENAATGAAAEGAAWYLCAEEPPRVFRQFLAGFEERNERCSASPERYFSQVDEAFGGRDLTISQLRPLNFTLPVRELLSIAEDALDARISSWTAFVETLTGIKVPEELSSLHAELVTAASASIADLVATRNGLVGVEHGQDLEELLVHETGAVEEKFAEPCEAVEQEARAHGVVIALYCRRGNLDFDRHW